MFPVSAVHVLFCHFRAHTNSFHYSVIYSCTLGQSIALLETIWRHEGTLKTTYRKSLYKEMTSNFLYNGVHFQHDQNAVNCDRPIKTESDDLNRKFACDIKVKLRSLS